MQDLALAEASEIYKLLVLEKGHFYVCGDCTMAEHVYQTLKNIIQRYGGMSDHQIEKYMLSLRVSICKSTGNKFCGLQNRKNIIFIRFATLLKCLHDARISGNANTTCTNPFTVGVIRLFQFCLLIHALATVGVKFAVHMPIRQLPA